MMTEVAAFITTMNFFACADTSAAASAFGVSRKPARISTLVAHDQLLRQPLGNVRRRAADVRADDLDLLAGDGVAVLLHVGLDAVVELDAGIGELAGQDVDQADLDRALRMRRRSAPQQRDRAAKSQNRSSMPILPHCLVADCLFAKVYSRKITRSNRFAGGDRAASIAPPCWAAARLERHATWPCIQPTGASGGASGFAGAASVAADGGTARKPRTPARAPSRGGNDPAVGERAGEALKSLWLYKVRAVGWGHSNLTFPPHPAC